MDGKESAMDATLRSPADPAEPGASRAPVEAASHRRLISVERINRQADAHGIATARVELRGSVDASKRFTCDTLAPLAYSPIFAELTEPQRLRYNQLVGLMQNEIICFFEQEFATRVLPALLRPEAAVPDDLARALRQFLEDERQHTQLFRSLNRLARPAWYARSDYHILRLPRSFRRLLGFFAARPATFPFVYWVMLIMEERSLLMSRRYAAMDAATLEPHFADVYRAHLEDEVRHVQLDWHLLERFYQSRPNWLRWLNARLLEAFVLGLFLKPRRANVRLVELLIEEFPELKPRRAELVRAVHELTTNPGYRGMMYSPESTPIAHALLESLPELASLRRRLYDAGEGR
jgi:hypothetical protein